MADTLNDLQTLELASQLAAGLSELEQLQGILDVDLAYSELASLLDPVPAVTWLDPQQPTVPMSAAQLPSLECAAPSLLLSDLSDASLTLSPASTSSLLAAGDLSMFASASPFQFNAHEFNDSLFLLPGAQRSSFSSLEGFNSDIPSPHGGSASDVSPDRASSPIDWPSNSDENFRGADLLASLTPRERDILESKGLSLDGTTPLSKEEEKRIRSERRKIRNKDSAKESRRKKTEYIQVLEKRAEASTQLKQRCDELEKENTTLLTRVAQMQKYIAELTRALPNTGAGFPLMMLLMTFSFLFAPSFLTGPSAGILSDNVEPAVVKSRVLLSMPDTCADPRTSSVLVRSGNQRGYTDKFSLLNARRVLGSVNHKNNAVYASAPQLILPSIAPEEDDSDVIDPSNETQQLPEIELMYADPFATGPAETALPPVRFLLHDTRATE